MTHLMSRLAALLPALAAWGACAQAQDTAVLDLVDRADRAIAQTRYALADSLLGEALRAAPGDPSNALVLSNLGMVRMAMGRDSDAVATLDRAVALAPASVTIRTNRARALMAAGQEQRAVADLERVMELDTTLSQPYFLRGLLRLRHGDNAGAEADFGILRRLDPDAPELDVALATLCDATGRWEEAVVHYNRAIILDPDPAYLAARARCNLFLSRFTEAGADLHRAMEMTPRDPELYLLRALLYKAQYRPDDAKADARRAVELGADPRRARELVK